MDFSGFSVCKYEICIFIVIEKCSSIGLNRIWIRWTNTLSLAQNEFANILFRTSALFFPHSMRKDCNVSAAVFLYIHWIPSEYKSYLVSISLKSSGKRGGGRGTEMKMSMRNENKRSALERKMFNLSVITYATSIVRNKKKLPFQLNRKRMENTGNGKPFHSTNSMQTQYGVALYLGHKITERILGKNLFILSKLERREKKLRLLRRVSARWPNWWTMNIYEYKLSEGYLIGQMSLT